MASAGNSDSTSAADKLFFCYQCNRTVTVSISSSTDPFCPLCNDGFLEEYEDPNPNPSPNLNPSGVFPFSDPLSSLLPILFAPSASPSSNVIDFFNPSIFGQPMPGRSTQPDPIAFDPVTFLQNHLQSLRSSGTHVQFVIENHPSDPEFRLPGNLGDYFFGPGLEQLIQQLAENDPNRYGTPPASKSAIDALPTVKVTEDLLNSEMNQCAVCMDEFEKGSDAKQMPCKHVYHQHCLLPWLQLHNSCPVCRYELPTDDPDYENMNHGAQRSGDGQGTGENQTTPRRFSISLPWPFRRQDGGSGSGSVSGAPGNVGGGANLETRQEDLD
ncbi:PREDICTED: E3 ubiquitin-protein ligase RING1-like isoform X2 [Tarenaya hassleriana]|uniref:E3 ubiquitin-protein ligase RING1-like isoform X2 n=1 Tax=Tarenaya hassleriana TaxID=28532 RepID=UPI00053CA635|nr:PREDICTED: E3 ubiquitin-protein ligase RING1-like isoform X2 [Tarenaya hassleriana]XP_010541864.1 PREDICTED: E3 ubiquitin-protein ligase RING1-like isoform X2 [Tarenaya hassleriana]XP_010541865.1 PREDICTED: E3 ubiquitin-protein ligase RING1-like isoform X2 [Tarenaya hassleriana]XP_010541866.1 PREDICTED: E3 ubiquitin-protein ligase RING1-like isoform X2 [Tarenaya hassleriana]XP_010541867.1 PREDICTED: E3 ubiquitin-protein ligase RING1-like isoform X2 [Tarenaya hassleriana]XP_010541868.1 PREDI